MCQDASLTSSSPVIPVSPLSKGHRGYFNWRVAFTDLRAEVDPSLAFHRNQMLKKLCLEWQCVQKRRQETKHEGEINATVMNMLWIFMRTKALANVQGDGREQRRTKLLRNPKVRRVSWERREESIRVFHDMCVQLVISHIMTDSAQVMCRNDLHAYSALYGFLNLFSSAECASTWNTTWQSCSNSRVPGHLTVSEIRPFSALLWVKSGGFVILRLPVGELTITK